MATPQDDDAERARNFILFKIAATDTELAADGPTLVILFLLLLVIVGLFWWWGAF